MGMRHDSLISNNKRIQKAKRRSSRIIGRSSSTRFFHHTAVHLVGLLLLLCCCFVTRIRAFSTTVATRLSSSLVATTSRHRRHGQCCQAAVVAGTIYSLYSVRRSAAATESSVHDDKSSRGISTSSCQSMLSLNDFLRDCKTRFQQNRNQQNQQYRFVIGNEAGDADSIMSALALAHVEALRRAAFSTTTITSDGADDNGDRPLIPIVSIPRQDLATQRPETLLLLKLAGIDASLEPLIFVNQLENLLHRTSSVHLTLVDHNRVSNSHLEQVIPPKYYKVGEILDHHHDEGAHVDSCPLSSPRRQVAFAASHGEGGKDDNSHGNHGGALVASTCTLVAERLISIWDSNDDGDAANTAQDSFSRLSPLLFPPSLALVLLGTILLDSVNMSPAAGKGTERDAKAIASLLYRTDWPSLPLATLQQLSMTNQTSNEKQQQQQQQQCYPDTTALFQVLQNAKFDLEFWKSLTVRDALHLDYKQFSTANDSSQQQPDEKESKSLHSHYTFGLSTVLMPMDDFLLKPNVRQEIVSYMQQEAQVDFMGIMLAFSDDSSVEDSGGKQIRRQLILCATTATAIQQDNLLQEIMDFFVHKKHDGDRLEIQEMQPAVSAAIAREDNDDGLTLRFADQGNTQASRKIVAPIFLQFFEQNLSYENHDSDTKKSAL